MTIPKTSHIATGMRGEQIAQKYLQQKGYVIVATNYLKKCGEIDIIARYGKMLHFVEVKTVISHKTASGGAGGGYRPEENVHPQKLHRLYKTIDLYLNEYNEMGEWQIDIITVHLVKNERRALVRFMKNIVV